MEFTKDELSILNKALAAYKVESRDLGEAETADSIQARVVGELYGI